MNKKTPSLGDVKSTVMRDVPSTANELAATGATRPARAVCCGHRRHSRVHAPLNERSGRPLPWSCRCCRAARAAIAVPPAAVAAAARKVRERERHRAPRHLGCGRRCRGYARGIVAVVVIAHVVVAVVVVVFVCVGTSARAMKARRTCDALDYGVVVGDRGDLLWREASSACVGGGSSPLRASPSPAGGV